MKRLRPLYLEGAAPLLVGDTVGLLENRKTGELFLCGIHGDVVCNLEDELGGRFLPDSYRQLKDPR